MSVFGLDLEKIPGVGKVIGIAERGIAVAEKMLANTDIMERWNREGFIAGKFSAYDYEIAFTIENKKKTAIEAEVVEVEE